MEVQVTHPPLKRRKAPGMHPKRRKVRERPEGTECAGETLPAHARAGYSGWNRDDRPKNSSPLAGRPSAQTPYIEKIAFSCWGEPAFRQAFTALERQRVLIAGIKTHICVLKWQTE
jgi:nicotinamidase-related amidase